MNKEAKEKLLVRLLDMTDNNNARAVLLQSFIQEEGPLTEATAKQVRAILNGDSPRG
jgi:hypothetical protein